MTEDEKDKKVVRIGPQTQYNVKEALEFALKEAGRKEVDRLVVIYHVKDQGLHFSCGSNTRDYSNADLNWDIDHFKLLVLTSEYEPVED